MIVKRFYEHVTKESEHPSVPLNIPWETPPKATMASYRIDMVIVIISIILIIIIDIISYHYYCN